MQKKKLKRFWPIFICCYQVDPNSSLGAYCIAPMIRSEYYMAIVQGVLGAA